MLGNFQEAHKNVVTLPEDDSYTFGLFVRWLYTGDYRGTYLETSINSAKTWILGDKLGATAFKNQVIEGLLDNSSEFVVEPDDLRYVYSHTTDGSKLRHFFADQAALEARELKAIVSCTDENYSALLREGGDQEALVVVQFTATVSDNDKGRSALLREGGDLASDLFLSFAAPESCRMNEERRRSRYRDMV